MLLAERIRANVAAMQSVRGRPVQVTVSLGVASYEGGSDSVDQLLKLADQRVYISKGLGRNRVTSTGDDDGDESRQRA